MMLRRRTGGRFERQAMAGCAIYTRRRPSVFHVRYLRVSMTKTGSDQQLLTFLPAHAPNPADRKMKGNPLYLRVSFLSQHPLTFDHLIATISCMSMVPMASYVKLELSMRIVRQGDRAKVAVAAEVSVVAAMPCAEDGLGLTVGFEAVNAPSPDGLPAADKHSKRRAWPGRDALDIAKNLLRWKVTKCVNLPRKTGSLELAYRFARSFVRACRSVHGPHGVLREAGAFHADRAPGRPRQGGSCR